MSKILCLLSHPPSSVEVSLVQKVLDFYKVCHDSVKLFPKLERYSLGQKIENTILEILELTLQAAYQPKYRKIETIRKASDKTDLLKYLLRLAYNVEAVNLKKYLLLEEKAIELGKMFGGWIKSLT